ncbi:hypothetical protein BC830DRAFT_544137 [Chytriomyces sp. MP71]|nr:hypothetical protein BC830DRAFT_544137 [Chytriomyces sp. MP71]
MFDLILEIVPSTLASILKAIGFTSNRGPACATLHAFAAGSSLRAPMAAFVLALDSASFMAPIGVLRMRKWSDETMLGRTPEGAFVAGGAVHPSIVAGVRGLAEGMKVVERALERWRSSPLFNLLAYYLHRKLGNTEDAEVFLNQAISWVDPEVVPYPTTLWFEMGCLLTFKCDWQSARKIFNSIWNFAGSVQQLNGISWDALNQSPQVPFSSPANARNGSLSTSDWFEFRPMAGLMLVGCMRAEEGPDLNTGGLSYETAKAVRKEIVLAVSSRRIKVIPLSSSTPSSFSAATFTAFA